MTNPTPPLDLDAIMARAEKATPGPWRQGVPGNLTVYYRDGMGELSGPIFPQIYGPQARENCTFIAHARTDIPALCDEVKRLMERDDAFKALLADIFEGCDPDEKDQKWRADHASMSQFTYGHFRRARALLEKSS